MIKMIAACVCPVAATVSVTVAVPSVKRAVHRMTAPRAYALPKVRESVAAPSVISAVPCEIPSAPITIDALSLAQPAIGAEGIAAAVGSAPLFVGIRGAGGGTIVPSSNIAPPAVPESATWMTMIAGFGVAGVVLRGRREEQIAIALADGEAR